MKVYNATHGQLIIRLDTTLDPAGVLVIEDIKPADSPSEGLTLHPARDPIGFDSSGFGPQVTLAMATASVNDMRTGMSSLYAGSVKGGVATTNDAASANGPQPNTLTASYEFGNQQGSFA